MPPLGAVVQFVDLITDAHHGDEEIDDGHQDQVLVFEEDAHSVAARESDVGHVLGLFLDHPGRLLDR